jgi:excinuclease ABC subunit C
MCRASDRINLDGVGDADVVALHQAAGQSCVQVFFFRGGRNNGNRPYFLTHAKQDQPPEEVMGAFLAQLYDDLPPPPLVLLSHDPPEAALLAEALALKAGRKVEIHRPQRGEKRARWSTPRPMRARRWSAAWPKAPRRGELLQGVAAVRPARHARSASRSTTTATSWARTPMA